MEATQTHALILTGGTEGARLAEARRLCAGALCLTAEGTPCGVCSACRRVLADGHPDVTFLVPETKDGKEAKEIKVAQARRLRADMSLIPHEGWYKAAVIRADALNVPSQNALLALLEEPPSHARFFLLSQTPSLLLPTLRSRCAVRRLPDPPEETAVSPEARSLWEALRSRDEWRWVQACLALEKTPREELSALLDGLAALIVRGQDTGGEGGLGGDALTARHFGGIIDKIRVFQDMLEANVSPGHVCGALMAVNSEP
ncbi:MAG: hypothetical protein LBT60_04375 [Oscillospiraceae bacterium]|jgi:hypothetical protein|nr:hypothetical protein [Oscillospiraceae bacterium]